MWKAIEYNSGTIFVDEKLISTNMWDIIPIGKPFLRRDNEEIGILQPREKGYDPSGYQILAQCEKGTIEGVPVVEVGRGNIEEMAKIKYPLTSWKTQSNFAQGAQHGFVEGYKASKANGEFSENDINRAIGSTISWILDLPRNSNKFTIDELKEFSQKFIASLRPKLIGCEPEMEENPCERSMMPCPNDCYCDEIYATYTKEINGKIVTCIKAKLIYE